MFEGLAITLILLLVHWLKVWNVLISAIQHVLWTTKKCRKCHKPMLVTCMVSDLGQWNKVWNFNQWMDPQVGWAFLWLSNSKWAHVPLAFGGGGVVCECIQIPHAGAKKKCANAPPWDNTSCKCHSFFFKLFKQCHDYFYFHVQTDHWRKAIC